MLLLRTVGEVDPPGTVKPGVVVYE